MGVLKTLVNLGIAAGICGIAFYGGYCVGKSDHDMTCRQGAAVYQPSLGSKYEIVQNDSGNFVLMKCGEKEELDRFYEEIRADLERTYQKFSQAR